MIAAFIVATQSLTVSVRQRTRLLGFVARILRRFRQHVKLTDGLTLTDNFCPSQTYSQSLLAVHCHINIDRCFRDFCPRVRQIHEYSGENECEKTFSRAGGNCEVRTWARKYNFKGLLDCVDSMHYIAWAQTGQLGERLQIGRAQHVKQEYINKLFERPEVRVRQRSELPPVEHCTDPIMVSAFVAGEQDADSLLRFMSKRPPHLNEFRDMDAWNESIGGPRRDLQRARQLMLSSRRSHREVNTEEAANQATRLMEDLAVDQELRAAGRAAFDHKVQLPQSMGL